MDETNESYMGKTTLYIKNMVCDRCIMAVDKTLRDTGLHPLRVELGVASVSDDMSDSQRERVRRELEALGFELIDDPKQQVVDQIKSSIIRLVHYDGNNSNANLSTYLQNELHQDYSSLSKLFSNATSSTVERYYIEQKVERIKELLTYGEKTLTEIAAEMNYSSVAYLSTQFKSVTGITPSQFKSGATNRRKSLDAI